MSHLPFERPARPLAATLSGARAVIVRALLVATVSCGPPVPLDHVVFSELVDMVLVPADPTDRSGTAGAFFIDRFEVTNGDYQRFLEASGYRAARPSSFLRHWPRDPEGRPTLPLDVSQEWRDTPVRWVNLEDARAYARFVGKRLPTAAEWARAARNERYPWGRHFHRYFCNVLATGIGHPTAVGTFEEGRSPAGCYDIVGNVWEWSTTRVSPWDGTMARETDASEAFYLIRGGSYADPAGRGVETDHARVDAPPPRLEAGANRNAALGFRCVLDGRPVIERALARLDDLAGPDRERGFQELLAYGEPLWDIVGRLDFESSDRRLWSRGVDPGTTLGRILELRGGEAPGVLLLGEDGRVRLIGGRDGRVLQEADLLGLIEERLPVSTETENVGERPRLVDTCLLGGAQSSRLAFTWRLEPASSESLWWWDSEAPSGWTGFVVLDLEAGDVGAFLARPGTRCDVFGLGRSDDLLVLVRDPPRAGAYEPTIEDMEPLGPFPGREDRRVVGPLSHRNAELLVISARDGTVRDSLRLSRCDLSPLDRPSGHRALLRAPGGPSWRIDISREGVLSVRGVRGLAPDVVARLVPVGTGDDASLVLVNRPGETGAALARWEPDSGRLESMIEIEDLDVSSVDMMESCRVGGEPGLLVAWQGEVMVLGLSPVRLVFRRSVPSLPVLVVGVGSGRHWATFREKGGVSLLDLETGEVRQRILGPVLAQAGADLDRDGQLDLCLITLDEPRLVAVTMKADASARGQLLARFLQQREQRGARVP